jgi:hypothetical protein
MAGKRKSIKKAPVRTQPLTLKNITIEWTAREGIVRSADGRCVAWLLARMGHLYGGLKLEPLDCATGAGPNLLRGLGALVFPDAGDPIADLDHDRRYVLDWVLGQVAAEQHANLCMDAELAGEFRVTVRS